MSIAEEDRPEYDAQPKPPRLTVVDDSPRFAVMWESVLFDPELSANAKVIYCVLQRMAYEAHGSEFAPTQEQIAERAGIKDRHTVAACLRTLKERGHIERTPRSQWEADLIVLVSPAKSRGEKSPNPRGESYTIDGENSPMVRGEKSPNHRGEKTPNLIGRELKRERERTTESHDSADFTPFHIFTAACQAANLDPAEFTDRDRGKHMAVAKRLLANGLTEGDLQGVLRWLCAQTWRTEPVTLFAVEAKLSEWRAAGRPEPAPPRNQRPAYKTQADWNSARQRNPDGTLRTVL